jgi:hypothetical protein
MKKIKTYEDACKALKLKPTALPDVSALPEKHRKAIIAHYKLVIIAEALNEGWTPNWNDENQYKYTAYFRVKASKSNPAGVGFSFTFFDIWRTGTGVGSRLCFKSSELAEYAGKQFENLFIDYFLIA